MPGPFLLREHECRALEVAGIPPGLPPGVVYDELSVRLEPGDSLPFCTDGVTEARNAHDEEFGTERLEELCGNCYANTPLVLLRAHRVVRIFTRLARLKTNGPLQKVGPIKVR